MNDYESEKTDQLDAKLLIVQCELGKITKNCTANAGKFSYSYADLPYILSECRPTLVQYKLIVVESFRPLPDGKIGAVTKIIDLESNQWRESIWPFAGSGDAQAQGSAASYGRRYNYQTLLSLVLEKDDDGAAARESHYSAATDNKTVNVTERPAFKSTGNADKQPRCPACFEETTVLKNKDEWGGGWSCYTNKGGCGAKFRVKPWTNQQGEKKFPSEKEAEGVQDIREQLGLRAEAVAEGK